MNKLGAAAIEVTPERLAELAKHIPELKGVVEKLQGAHQQQQELQVGNPDGLADGFIEQFEQSIAAILNPQPEEEASAEEPAPVLEEPTSGFLVNHEGLDN